MKKKQPLKKGLGKLQPEGKFPWWYIGLMLLLLWLWQDTFTQFTVQTIPYSEFKAYLVRGEVTECSVRDTEITGRIVPKGPSPLVAANAGKVSVDGSNASPAVTRKGNRKPPPNEPFLFRTVRVEDSKLVEELEKAHVEFSGVPPSFISQFMLAWVLPIVIMIVLWTFISRRMGGGPGQSILSIGKSRARLVADRDTGVTFDQVAGCEEAKFELQEVVDFLKNPKRYEAIGARIPKGVLLVGPPGTGKTLLARAVAGEAKVPFYSISGSDFVEMFVGVGAARVRDMFLQAKNSAPCIVFIDELDAVGRQRGVHMGAVNDEREQTLNQLLVEMDGFEANAGVILLAATNRPEVLDKALLRPGRFDRQIVVDAPDAEGREAILKVHSQNKPLSPDVDLRRIARATPGFSGADLANAMNEAALLTARRHSKLITQPDIEEAIEKVVAGPERKSRRLGEEQKRRVAYHEVGHALAAAHSKHADPVHKISIIPRGRAALGYTMQLPTEDQFLMTKSELLDRIRGLLGGRAAEELVFDEVSTGAENDLERATMLARQMVCVYGMSEAIGLQHCAQRPNPYLQNDGGWQKDCSEETAREVDEEVKRMLDQGYVETKELLETYRKELELVSAQLLKHETLDAVTFYKLIGLPVPRDKRPAIEPPPIVEVRR